MPTPRCFMAAAARSLNTLEELRKVRAERDQRPFVILGASGAGKSSLLKAGIIPRLRREAPAWLPLRAFRPGADPLFNFAEALARTFADFDMVEAPGIIRDRLLAAWDDAKRAKARTDGVRPLALEAALESEGSKLRRRRQPRERDHSHQRRPGRGDGPAEGDGGEALADYLRAALLSASSPVATAFTIRTDNFPELQKRSALPELESARLRSARRSGFPISRVIEDPAKRYGVRSRRAFDALIADAPEEDALPLLAFALQRLWRQYGASGSLNKENYDTVGGLRGLIEDAAERALRGILPGRNVALGASDPPRRLTMLAAATFVPALVQINAQGQVIRRIAHWDAFDEDAQALLENFREWRLLVLKTGEGQRNTIEVVHEALFQEWDRLRIGLSRKEPGSKQFNHWNKPPVFGLDMVLPVPGLIIAEHGCALRGP